MSLLDLSLRVKQLGIKPRMQLCFHATHTVTNISDHTQGIRRASLHTILSLKHALHTLGHRPELLIDLLL